MICFVIHQLVGVSFTGSLFKVFGVKDGWHPKTNHRAIVENLKGILELDLVKLQTDYEVIEYLYNFKSLLHR